MKAAPKTPAPVTTGVGEFLPPTVVGYLLVIREFTPLSMSFRMMAPMCQFEIVWIDADGRRDREGPAWLGTEYRAEGTSARQVAGYRLAATKVLKRYEQHIIEHGQRIEILDRVRHKLEREARAAQRVGMKVAARLAQRK